MEQRKGNLIENIRDSFSKFEDNMNNELGGDRLVDALECAQKVLMESNNEIEHRIVKNLISTYRVTAIERARTLCSSDIPDSKQLEYIKDHIQSFEDYGFNNDSSLCDMKSEIDSQYFKAFIYDCFGKPTQDLTVEDKAILRKMVEQVERQGVNRGTG